MNTFTRGLLCAVILIAGCASAESPAPSTSQSLILDARQNPQDLQQRALQLQSRFNGDPKPMVEEIRRNNPTAFYYDYDNTDTVSHPGRGKTYSFLFKQKVGWGYKATSVTMETARTNGIDKVDRIYAQIYKPDIVGEVPFKAEGNNFRLDTIGMRPEVAARIAYLAEREHHSFKRILAVLQQQNPSGKYIVNRVVPYGPLHIFRISRGLTQYSVTCKLGPDGDTVTSISAYYGIPGL